MNCKAQETEMVNRTIDYYFEQIAELEMKELLKQKVMIDSSTIARKYRNWLTGRLNDKGFEKYTEIKANIYKSFFNDYLYQQKVEYGDDIYALYFTMAGFDDMQWDILKWKKEEWTNKERVSREKVENNRSIEKILWNYDEGPKNRENIQIFIQNDYLVMERGNLYHSLYDLKNEKVILNEESPWHESGGGDKQKMNDWIEQNLHNKIKQILNDNRE